MATTRTTRLDELLQDRSLRNPDQLERRIDALEQLESWLFHDSWSPLLRQKSEALVAELEAINQRLFQTIRHDIRQGRGAETLRTWAASMSGTHAEESYGSLDTLISGVLDFKEPPDAIDLEPEMVFYQPTPARHIFDFIERASLTHQDVVMDLGAGLGHVTLLTAICTAAQCVGIELQPAHVASARQCADELQVHNAQFIAQDVREADVSRGTVFYLYTPFTGGILRTVLDTLKREAESRAIRLCTLGPCTTVVANEPWLKPDGACSAKRTVLFRSV
ncbi:methyltransferase domain-containing protein [Dyella acidisoli]|uniref:methyltransferase domain-containing protein n=1 Tax=Dyella acidisoli TaxID=1867834 RepID=UPI0024E13B36|nr:methyltransferase domain-containing protein [Dyella acidisoli]